MILRRRLVDCDFELWLSLGERLQKLLCRADHQSWAKADTEKIGLGAMREGCFLSSVAQFQRAPTCIGEEQPPGFRQCDPAMAPGEQRKSEPVLQDLYAAADGRLVDV